MLCITIEDFLVAVHARERPELRGVPVAVVEPEGRRVVLQVSREAVRLGVLVGMTQVQARGVSSELVCLDAAPALYAQAIDALMTRLSQVGPRLERAGPGLVYMETRGLGKIYGKMEVLVEKVLEMTRSEEYASARVGVGRTKLIARLAALQGGGIVGVAAEKTFLGALPVNVLEPDEGLREQLFLLGIHTLGQLAGLDPGAVESRYGPDGARLHRMARGLEDDVFRPWMPVTEWSERVDCELPVSEVERLVFLLAVPLERLLERLSGEGLACRALSVELHVEDRGVDERQLALAVPSGAAPAQAARTFLELLRLEVARAGLAGPVTRVELSVRAAAAPHAEQGRLFGRPPVSVAAIAQVAAKLSARLGDAAVFSPELVDSWRPEEAYRRGPLRLEVSETGGEARGSKKKKRVAKREQPGGRESCVSQLDPRFSPPGLRVLPEPSAARVTPRPGRCAGEEPGELEWAGASRRVVASSGPWSRDGEWWSGGFSRDYFEVETADGARLWLYRDRVTGGWFVHGVFE
ncbi:MAG: DNA polymerase Y family protein [Candidatus Wallbacteria bacterium]|nr:DNA polymerase Y family protein [Candidatus Wallbacteria bacterium]